MLKRQVGANGVVFYFSPLLQAIGVPHAFSTRLGGISRPPFDSLNLGNPNGCDIQDDYDHIWQNYRLIEDAAGCGGRELLRLHQVHGCGVARARGGEAFDVSEKGDALVTDDPARALSVRVADCVPILMASLDGQTVAAIHAGWRGIIAGAAPAAIAQMSAPPGTLVAAIGPCIGHEAFEVGGEVLRAFTDRFGSAAPVEARPGGKGRVDLRQAVRLQLLESGLPEHQIDTTDRCTFTHAEEFFSHRRDHGVTGRMAAIIGPKGDHSEDGRKA